MLQRRAVAIIVWGFFIFSAGCATAPRTVGGAAAGFYSGIKEDSKNLWDAVIGADNWVEENFW